MENVTLMSVPRSQPPKITPFPAGFFSDCEATDPCAPTKPPVPSYYSGICVPNKGSILACSKKLSNCACSLEPSKCRFDARGCFYQLQIIDIYIINDTNQQLHLKDSKIDLIINELGEEEEEVVGKSGITSDFMVGWVSSTFAPPKVVDIGDTVLVRGAVSCINKCCRSDVTFQINLAYHVGIPSKELGILNASVCRNKLKESKDSIESCADTALLCSGALGCKIHFGELEQCPGTTTGISPPSDVYSVEPNINNTQFTLLVIGGNGGGCNSRKDCPNNERCVNGNCFSATGATGCVEGSCEEGFVCTDGHCIRKSSDNVSRKTAIIIAVSAASIIIVFAFLFYLADLSKKNK